MGKPCWKVCNTSPLRMFSAVLNESLRVSHKSILCVLHECIVSQKHDTTMCPCNTAQSKHKPRATCEHKTGNVKGKMPKFSFLTSEHANTLAYSIELQSRNELHKFPLFILNTLARGTMHHYSGHTPCQKIWKWLNLHGSNIIIVHV